jgi:hypothetical protein
MNLFLQEIFTLRERQSGISPHTMYGVPAHTKTKDHDCRVTIYRDQNCSTNLTKRHEIASPENGLIEYFPDASHGMIKLNDARR